MSDNLDSELTKLDAWLSGLIGALDPPSRKKAAGKIAMMLRGSHAKQIAAQQEPDGSGFAPRKTREKAARTVRPVKFLYPSGGSGKPRAVFMKSWRRDGPLYVGYDREAGGLRSFDRAKIIKFLPLNADERGSGKAMRRPSIRQRAMFRKLRTYRHLRAEWSTSEASVGFEGRSAAIARVHQQGGIDAVSENGPRVRYAERRLLGTNARRETEALDIMVAMFDGA